MLRIGDAQIPWTPLLEVAQVMQRAMSLLVSIGRVTTPRTRVPDVVATVGDELGRRQVGGGCDPFTRVGAILSGTGHRVGLLAHRLDPDYTVHAWRGKPGILAIVSTYWEIMVSQLVHPRLLSNYKATGQVFTLKSMGAHIIDINAHLQCNFFDEQSNATVRPLVFSR